MKKLLTLLFCASLFLGTAYATPWYDAVVGTSAVSGVNLDFTGGILPAGVTFSRASLGYDGSYFNASGVLANASANTARFDYDPVALTLRGLLYEPQATNRLSSSDISIGFLQSITITPNQITSPDGAMNGYLIKDGSGQIELIRPAPSSYSAGNYTFSVFAKQKEQYIVQILDGSGLVTGHFTTNYDVNAGTVAYASGAVGAITNAGNGWYRPASTFVALTQGSAQVDVSFTGNNPTANRVSAAGPAGTGYYLWGWQVETGNKATSYIPTNGTAATRAADVLSFTIPSGVGHLTYIFDDNSTQIVAVSAGAYTVPTNLNRAWIKTIVSSP